MHASGGWLYRLSVLGLKRWLVVCVALAIVACLSYAVQFYSVPVFVSQPPSSGHGREGVFTKVPLAKNRTSVPGVAFTFLALGAQANQMNCGAAIETLVKHAGWGGDVYLITDRKRCFSPSEIIADAGMDKSKFHYVQVEQDFSRGGVDLTHPKVGARKSRVRSFGMKTKLFEYVRDPSIHTLAYVDCDVLFGIDGCAADFVTAGPSWEEAPIRFSHLYRDHDGELIDIHAGSFVVHREHSKQLLDIWQHRLALRKDEGDNDAFMAAYREFRTPVSSSSSSPSSSSSSSSSSVHTDNHAAHSPPHRLRQAGNASTTSLSSPPVRDASSLSSPSLWRNPMEPALLLPHRDADPSLPDNRFEKFSKGVLGDIQCINHISKKRCEKFGRETFQKYVQQFSLRTYKHGESYCVSTWLKTLQYGWFPFGYLPGCPKLEGLL